MARILIVDDEEKIRYLLSIMIGRRAHLVDQAKDGAEALEMVSSTPYDMVITDMKMPRLDGTGLLKQIMLLDIPCPVVFITAFATVESAVEAMRMGAADYLTKPFEEESVLLTVERTLKLSRIMAENRDLKKQLDNGACASKMIFESKVMSDIIDLAAKVGKSDSAILISGESGTGKELLAKYIHGQSLRSHKRFVPLNCAAISPNLVESELFGYEKGAFTGANKRSIGKFEYASGGTLFLDEIGDLPLDAQAKLLRALQEKKIQRVGGNAEIPVDVRIVCATHQDLDGLVEKNRFRRDLYYRINVFPLSPPPLRERKEDIPALAVHFLKESFNGNDVVLTDGAKRLLAQYPWPGNVRELANAIERAVILEENNAITAQTLSFLKKAHGPGENEGDYKLPPDGVCLQTLETDIVRQALDMAGQNQTVAAKMLGLTRAKFRVLMKRD
ncbi:two-component sensory box histidine kinase/response regulator protein [Desulforapulum autotrophicum HRM2]|uniref:Two-component sensory box histidine kinase/response regulator protein n=1 Tax=Desulforapulum autotrophicum (strain ATCC 43914 / DSM 3382 / VKM B-1955 / HRM2) TaxID=177437 RepID=C0QK65_DESAH|nr:sigma-54 dependent transcriptional regulator [Desulforapulum autotrophicum]ACN16091.1 two-component sensory box histidine kinase/response regulator protein [Desulforapulum autotrophicum HRM2]